VQLALYNFLMPYTINTFWANKLAATPNVKHCYYRLVEVPQIPDVPGLYSWHLWIDNANSTKYSQIFKHKRVKVNIEANLTEKFEGDLHHAGYDTDIFQSKTDMDICNLASIAMCPPLYIGISGKLGQRLKQHTDELEKIIKGAIPTPVDTIRKRQYDTIYESQHFAERMGYVISKLNSLNAPNLLIKTLEMPMTYTKQDLQTIEKFLNRTYIPIYGRR